MPRRIAIVMAGGGGSRLWPASTAQRPKQLMDGLPEESKTLLAATFERIDALVAPEDRYVVTTREQVPALRRALPDLGEQQIIAEPLGRNTAPCLALTLLCLRVRLERAFDDATLVILPADHHLADPEGLRTHLSAACRHAEHADAVATLGIRPTRPDTGFGYIEYESEALPPITLDGEPAAHAVRRFVEKPDSETARAYVESGHYLWNAGIFVTPAPRLEREFADKCPSMWTKLSEAAPTVGIEPSSEVSAAYAELTPAPIDTAIAEKLDDMIVVPADIGWSDLGTWRAIKDALAADTEGNVVRSDEKGQATFVDAQDNIVWTEGASVGLIGVSGLAVVVVDGRVLVCSVDQAQRVRELVDKLSS